MSTEYSTLTEPVPEELLQDNRLAVQFIDGLTGDALSSELSVKLENPYHLDLASFVPQDQCYMLEDFYRSLEEVLADLQVRQGIQEPQRLQLTQEYPMDPMAYQGDSVVAFKVISREPGKMDVKGTGRPNRRFGHSYQYSPAADPNKVVIVESRPVDHVIGLDVWAKTATIANEKALWLERNLIRERWAFKIRGVDKFEWLGRGQDTVWTPSQTRLHQRPLKFMVRLYEFMPRAHNQIKDIVFTVRNRLI